MRGKLSADESWNTASTVPAVPQSSVMWSVFLFAGSAPAGPAATTSGNNSAAVALSTMTTSRIDISFPVPRRRVIAYGRDDGFAAHRAALEHWGCKAFPLTRSRSTLELVRDLPKRCQPGGAADPRVAAEANDHRVRVGRYVYVLPVLPEGVKAGGPVRVEPPEVPVVVVVDRVGGAAGGGGRGDPLPRDDSSPVPLAVVEEEEPEAGVVDRPRVEAALHLLEPGALGVGFQVASASAPSGFHSLVAMKSETEV